MDNPTNKEPNTTVEALKLLERWSKWRSPRKGETAVWYEALGGEHGAFVQCRSDIRNSLKLLKKVLSDDC